MESNHHFLDVSQASWPLDHGTGWVGRIVNPSYKVDPPGFAPGFPACGAGVFLLDDEPVLECGIRNAECRMTRFNLPQFRIPIPRSALTSSGGWNRTTVLLGQSQASLPAATAPEGILIFVFLLRSRHRRRPRPRRAFHSCRLRERGRRRGRARSLFSQLAQTRGEGVEPPSLGSKPSSVPLAHPRVIASNAANRSPLARGLTGASRIPRRWLAAKRRRFHQSALRESNPRGRCCGPAPVPLGQEHV